MPIALQLVLAAALLAGTTMVVLWLVQIRTGNAAVVDVGWAGSLAALAVLYAAFGDGRPERRWTMAAMVAVWGGRLAWHLLRTRVIGQPEEGRYQHLRQLWHANLQTRFFVFFQFQAGLAVLLSAPFLLAALDPQPLSAVEYAAAGLWLSAFTGELLADRQLAAFKADPANHGRVCDAGLWHYSRHPNYFFEWIIWVAFALFAIASPWGSVGLVSPALILYFLLRVTGIPATEAQAVRSKGDAYRRYQQTTSAFVPWWPRRDAR